MPIQPHQLPDDIDALKALVAEQASRADLLEAEKNAAETENVHLGDCAARQRDTLSQAAHE